MSDHGFPPKALLVLVIVVILGVGICLAVLAGDSDEGTKGTIAVIFGAFNVVLAALALILGLWRSKKITVEVQDKNGRPREDLFLLLLSGREFTLDSNGRVHLSYGFFGEFASLRDTKERRELKSFTLDKNYIKIVV